MIRILLIMGSSAAILVMFVAFCIWLHYEPQYVEDDDPELDYPPWL